MGVIFHDTTPISFIKAYGCYFLHGGNFREEDTSAKNAKITPTQISTFTEFEFIQIDLSLLNCLSHILLSILLNVSFQGFYSLLPW